MGKSSDDRVMRCTVFNSSVASGRLLYLLIGSVVDKGFGFEFCSATYLRLSLLSVPRADGPYPLFRVLFCRLIIL